MSARYFRSTPAVYESVRAQLDAAWGYPTADGTTQTAIMPADQCPQDAAGRVYLAVDPTFCEYVLPSQLLPELLASGAVEEIDEATYMAEFPSEIQP